ncbi:MAG: NAD(P)H-hydrate dehydratase [Woeseiaceae bacterium]|nr:NAD(P)H-hydrate dehydratase [Woeseiaceae bacterium]
MTDADHNPGRYVYDVAGVQAIDRAAIHEAGIPGYELMTRAAGYALDVALAEFPGSDSWVVLCGGGNNAGDGYALARLAARRGLDVSVRHVSDPDRLTGAAATAWRDCVAAGVPIGAFDGALPGAAGLLVDGLLGSGLARDVAGQYAAAVAAVNDHPAPVLALDIPTGVHGDTGKVLGSAVRADVTVTFVGQKLGLYLAGGPDACGRLVFHDLDIPASCYDAATPVLRRIGMADVASALPPRHRQAHKGDFGHVVIVGGAPGMPGAVRLAGEAALRCGAGRVSIATHPQHAGALPAGRPELMCHAVTEPAELAALLQTATVVALGPGLGRDEWSRRLFAAARDVQLPSVVDADGLNLLAEAPDSRADRVLTPHPGEAGRLLGCTARAVQADRRGALDDLIGRYGGAVVLKGCASLVGVAAKMPWLSTAGNPGMATAGTGDVLTGVVAALLAQGLDAELAAVVGVAVHARAGDVAAQSGGERGLLASDLLAELRPWVNP